MATQHQLMTYLTSLETEVKTLRQQVEKYQQETQYVCLKVGISDWMQFMTSVRLGSIAKNNSINSASNNQRPNLSAKNQSALDTFNELFASLQTNRNSNRKQFCQCESPILSQAEIEGIRGGDTSRCQSSIDDTIPNFQFQKQASKTDPFEQYRLVDIWSPRKALQQQSIEQILKYIDKYELQKRQGTRVINSLQGFDTFRKVQVSNSEQKTMGETTINSERQLNSPINSNTIKKQSIFNASFLKQKTGSASQNSYSNKLQFELSDRSNMDDYLLAIQNTKLRRQIHQLSLKYQGLN